MFKDNLKILRSKKGYTQQEMANLLSVKRPTYTRYEIGTNEPDYDTLVRMANIFDTSVDYLLNNDVKKSSPTSEDIELDELLQEAPNKEFVRKFDLLTGEQKDMIIAQMEVLIKNHQPKP